jgi:hypothetical protein
MQLEGKNSFSQPPRTSVRADGRKGDPASENSDPQMPSDPVQRPKHAAPADGKVALRNEPPVLEALERQSRTADQRLQLAGAQEPIGRQMAGVEPESRREMPVPAVATVGSQTDEDASDPADPVHQADGTGLVEQIATAWHRFLSKHEVDPSRVRAVFGFRMLDELRANLVQCRAQIHPGAKVRENTAAAFFSAELDTYEGNSGSPCSRRRPWPRGSWCAATRTSC